MLLDSTHRKWADFTLVLFVASVAAYVPYAHHELNGASGGTRPGLAYGIAGSVCIVFAAIFGIRKKMRAWRIGRTEKWLKAHLWLGLLAGPLILLHAGFHGGGAVTVATLILLAVVIVSGIVGIIIQNYVPRNLMTRVPFETVFSQLDHVGGQLLIEADKLVTKVAGPIPELATAAAKAAPAPAAAKPAATAVVDPNAPAKPIKEFYLGEVRRFLADGRSGMLSSSANTRAAFDRLRTLVPPTLEGTVADLEEICEERRQLELQRKMHRLLHGWILVHAPLAYALVVLGAVHAVMALRY